MCCRSYGWKISRIGRRVNSRGGGRHCSRAAGWIYCWNVSFSGWRWGRKTKWVDCGCISEFEGALNVRYKIYDRRAKYIIHQCVSGIAPTIPSTRTRDPRTNRASTGNRIEAQWKILCGAQSNTGFILIPTRNKYSYRWGDGRS